MLLNILAAILKNKKEEWKDLFAKRSVLYR